MDQPSDHDLLIRIDERVCHIHKTVTNHLAHHDDLEKELRQPRNECCLIVLGRLIKKVLCR